MRALLVACVIALAGCADAPADPGGSRGGDGADAGESVEDVRNGTGKFAEYGVNGDPFVGNPDAAVQVISYEAPGCSNCRFYHFNELPKVLAEYADTQRIGYHFLQFRVGYAYDITGGIAAECAFAAGGTAAYNHIMDLIFGDQRESRLDDYLQDTADAFALDATALQACYDNRDTEDEVWADINGGYDSGAGWNPGFAVIGPDGVEFVRGSSGPAEAIERALA